MNVSSSARGALSRKIAGFVGHESRQRIINMAVLAVADKAPRDTAAVAEGAAASTPAVASSAAGADAAAAGANAGSHAGDKKEFEVS